jgi:hypothetical protein
VALIVKFLAGIRIVPVRNSTVTATNLLPFFPQFVTSNIGSRASIRKRHLPSKSLQINYLLSSGRSMLYRLNEINYSWE